MTGLTVIAWKQTLLGKRMTNMPGLSATLQKFPDPRRKFPVLVATIPCFSE